MLVAYIGYSAVANYYKTGWTLSDEI